MQPTWKPNWPETRTRLEKWWNHQGLVVHLTAARPAPREGMQRIPRPADPTAFWLDPHYRTRSSAHYLASQDFLLESFPYFDSQIGPGSLAITLGSAPLFDFETVWYQSCITDPDTSGPIRFDPRDNPGWQAHLALIEEGLRLAGDRYPVGMPDLVEGLDTLAALRGNAPLLFDLIERPDWVCARLAEINSAYFTVFGLIYERIKDELAGNAFSAFKIWGPGKTAKLQCDFSAMISPRMYDRFVVPYLSEQCAWLDYSMYHLDGTNAHQHLDLLLSVDRLNAIEWTPQAGRPSGGSPQWYNLYRRIKAAGKSVQAVGVEYEDVIPLLDAVGPQGMFIILAHDGFPPDRAEQLVKQLEPYYADCP